MTSASDSAKMMLSTGAIDRWVKAAEVDAVLLYARQPVLPQKASVGEHVRLIAERGFVRHEPQRRCAADRGLFEYRIRRTGKPFASATAGAGSAGTVRHAHGYHGCGAIAAQLLDLIAEAAAADEPCPPEKLLGAALGRSLSEVRKEMQQLRLAGELVLESRPGDYGLPRRVAILPRRGLATAMPVFMIPGLYAVDARA